MWRYFTQSTNWYKLLLLLFRTFRKLFMSLIENQKITSPIRRENIKKTLKHRATSTWRFWFSSTLAAFGNILLHATPASCLCSTDTSKTSGVVWGLFYLVFLAAEWAALFGVTAKQWAWSDKVTEKTCFVMLMVCKGSWKDYPSSQGETWRDKHPLSSERTPFLTLPAIQNSEGTIGVRQKQT